MTKNAVIYTRVSTDEQAERGYSLGHQEDRIRKYAEIQKINVVAHFQDDYSAKTFNRPEFTKLLAYVKANKKNIHFLIFLK